MSSSSREKATPPASPVPRGRSPWRAGDVPVKTRRSRTLGRVAVLLLLLSVMGYFVLGRGVCGQKCAQTTAWLENGARRTGEYVGGGSVLPGTDAQHAAMLALVGGADEVTDDVLKQNYDLVQLEMQQQQARVDEAALKVVQGEGGEDEVTREDMVDAMNGQGDHANETELVEEKEKEPEHVYVQSQGVGEGGEAVMGSMEGGGGGGGF